MEMYCVLLCGGFGFGKKETVEIFMINMILLIFFLEYGSTHNFLVEYQVHQTLKYSLYVIFNNCKALIC